MKKEHNSNNKPKSGSSQNPNLGTSLSHIRGDGCGHGGGNRPVRKPRR